MASAAIKKALNAAKKLKPKSGSAQLAWRNGESGIGENGGISA